MDRTPGGDRASGVKRAVDTHRREESRWIWRTRFPLKGGQLDDGFVGLIRDASGHSDFWVQGKHQKITVSYGPKFTVAVAYAPPGQNFICFEPMSALTNGFNLAHAGKWDGLQSIAAGSEWRETFEIRPSGF